MTFNVISSSPSSAQSPLCSVSANRTAKTPPAPLRLLSPQAPFTLGACGAPVVKAGSREAHSLTFNVISSSPALTEVPSFTSTWSTIPSIRATTEVSIFMA